MSNPPGLTEADRADIHARLTSWFGDDRQAFLVSHLAPVIDRIKADAVAEYQWNAVEMARKADLAERRAVDAEAEVERLRDVLGEIGAVFNLQCPPMPSDRYVDQGAWVAHSWWNTVLGNILKREALLADLKTEPSREGDDTCPDCGGRWTDAAAAGCKRPWHHSNEWRWEQVAETTQGSGDDAWTVGVFQERGCDHEWLDRPESDTRVCELCGVER